MKEHEGLTDEIKEYIADPKSAFFSPSCFVCKGHFEFMHTLVGSILYHEFRTNGLLYQFVKALCNIRYAIFKKMARYKK